MKKRSGSTAFETTAKPAHPISESDFARDAGEPGSSRRFPTALWLILAASSALGILAVLQFERSPFADHPVLDEHSYVTWADTIASGDVLGQEIFYQDPLYPYILAAVFALFGKNLLFARLLQVAMGTASVALVYWMSRQILGRRQALLAAALLASCSSLYFFEVVLVKATTVLFLSALSCALGVAAVVRPARLLPWFGLGASLGLLTLLRGNFLALLPAALLWSVLTGARSTPVQRFQRGAMVLCGILALMLPITLRNYRVGGELVLTTSQGGANFYIGNNEEATGVFRSPSFVRANPVFEARDFELEAERRVGQELSPSEVSRYWFAEALQWMRANPAAAARLWLHKARLLIHRFEIPDNHSLYLLRDLFVPVLWMPLLGLGILWGLAVPGLWIVVRKTPRAAYPAIFALAYAGSIIPFFIAGRYRQPLLPAVALFSAAFIDWALGKIRARDTKALLAAATIPIAALTVGFLPTPESGARLTTPQVLLANAYLKSDQPQQALRWYEKVLEADPGHDSARRNRDSALDRIATREIESLAGEGFHPSKRQISSLVLEVRGLSPSETNRLGYGYLDKDPERAFALYLMGAQQGFAPSQNNLGYMYQYGLGVEQDYKAAIRWYQSALEQMPIAAAQNNLGFIYLEGLGVEKDFDQALAWFREAAAQGYAPAQNNLGALYQHGLGVPRDLEEAERWYRRSAAQGYAEAQDNLHLLLQKNPLL